MGQSAKQARLYRNKPHKGKPTADIHIIGEFSSTDLKVINKGALHVNDKHGNYDMNKSITIEGDVYINKAEIGNRVVTSKLKIK